MNKLMTAVTVALSIASSAYAAADVNPVAELPDKTASEQEPGADSAQIFEAGFDNDFLTAYVWRNSVVNDRPVWQPCVWADLTCFEPFWIGGYVWQNWDLTNRRSGDGMPRAMNETDYNVHVGATLWESEDEEWSVELEAGHEWFSYRPKSGFGADYPASYEFYAKATFNNPFVNFYAQYSQAYHPTTACHFELGLNKELNLGEAFDSECEFLNALTFGADWNLNLGSGKYLTEYLYGDGKGGYDEDEESFEHNLGNGVGGTTIKVCLAWAVCDHFSVGLVAAYTGILNGDVRDGLTAAGYGDNYRSLAWGGLQAKLSF